jgi:hypothetical protein
MLARLSRFEVRRLKSAPRAYAPRASCRREAADRKGIRSFRRAKA